MANPRGQQRDKPFRDALRMEIAAAQGDEDFRSLRKIARGLLQAASEAKVDAIREIADRLDGKVAQAVIGGDDDDAPIKLETITRVIVGKKSDDPDGGGVPPATGA